MWVKVSKSTRSRSVTPCSISVSAIAIELPPRHTPHSTNAPGTSAFTT
jgi:hypothetical protein